MRCKAKTLLRKRCHRLVSDPNQKYCWQHQLEYYKKQETSSYQRRKDQIGKGQKGGARPRISCRKLGERLRCDVHPERTDFASRWYFCDQKPLSSVNSTLDPKSSSWYQCKPERHDSNKDDWSCQKINSRPTRANAKTYHCQKNIPKLDNLNNTCYFNSAIRCLFIVEDFIDHFMKKRYYQKLLDHYEPKIKDFKGPLAGDINAVTYYFLSLIKSLAEDPEENFRVQLQLVVPQICQQFYEFGRQEDTSEFLSYLLEALNESLKKEKGDNIVEKVFKVHRSATAGLLLPPFYLLDPSTNLPKDNLNIQNLLNQELQINIGDLKNPPPHWLILSVSRDFEPEIKKIQVMNPKTKKFEWRNQIIRKKILNQVDYPDLIEWNYTYYYQLMAVTVHIGEEPTGGHYISYINIGNKWYLYNDSNPPQLMNQDQLIDLGVNGTSNVYFYKRV